MKTLTIHPADNVAVALTDLPAGAPVGSNGIDVQLTTPVAAKHKFALRAFAPGDEIIMYGVLVGKAVEAIEKGAAITTKNIVHAARDYAVNHRRTAWQAPDVSRWQERHFMGYHRADGSVGTANHWIVIPMVFCENVNVEAVREAFAKALGYAPRKSAYEALVENFVQHYQGGNLAAIKAYNGGMDESKSYREKLFKNIDGIKVLTHTLGCGGTRGDARALCGLLAGYITHPNVAGATVLSLGCQNAQVEMLKEELMRRDSALQKPVIILEQQQTGSETALLQEAVKQTFLALAEANKTERRPAPLSKLCLGLECGGSDGFSGISANPAVGYTSDLLVALGGSVILSEFPELNGVEQELTDRCVNETIAQRFGELMQTYNSRATALGSGFHANPSPGNIRDGLVTDAIKSAGAAKKGGTSPVVDVLDYPEKIDKQGLTLLCTPGGDVESTTAEVGAGANIVLFTTGLGTPTGNPVAPVLKIATNTKLYVKMQDITDINTGTIIEGTETIEQAGARILDYAIDVASGLIKAKAAAAGHDDFIPWKRGISL